MRVWRAVRLLLTLRCEQSHQLMAAFKQRKLSPVERWAVRLHHIVCSYCRRVAKQLSAVDQLAQGRSDVQAELSDEARRRIAAEVVRAERD